MLSIELLLRFEEGLSLSFEEGRALSMELRFEYGVLIREELGLKVGALLGLLLGAELWDKVWVLLGSEEGLKDIDGSTLGNLVFINNMWVIVHKLYTSFQSRTKII